MNLISLNIFYYIIGAILGYVTIRIILDKKHPSRVGSSVFWGICSFIFIFGSFVKPVIVGYLLLIMVLVASIGRVKPPAQEDHSRSESNSHATKLNGKIFIPAILIPIITVIGSFTFGKIHFGNIHFVDSSQVTLISLGLGTIISFIAAKYLTKAKVAVPMNEGSRLIQSVGWAILIPQMLAALAGIFAKAGVGDVIAKIVESILPTHIPFVAVAAYCIAMALFTMIMGGAFAAFAVITSGIGLPLIVHVHGGNPAIMAAIGMYAGYCGTLMTPMAASYNIVPTMLLELEDQNAIVKTQIPIGIPLLLINILLMYFFVFRF